LLFLFGLHLLVASRANSRRHSTIFVRPAFCLKHDPPTKSWLSIQRKRIPNASHSFIHIRGGSIEIGDDSDDDSSDDENEKSSTTTGVDTASGPDSEQQEGKQTPKSVSEPVPVTIKTATGSKLLDQSIELLTVNRNRNIASLKQSVSRQLPSRPPIATIQLTIHGKILDDDVLISDLIEDQEDDDDDDEAEEGSKEGIVLHLDMIPAVDPKFVPELERKIPDVTNEELLEAYAINEAAIYHNAALILKEEKLGWEETNDDEGESEKALPLPVNRAIREQAERIKQNLKSTVLSTENSNKLLADLVPPSKQETQKIEIKGQRVRRTGTVGVKGNWKRVIQQNMNVNWAVTIRHFLLFLFFGWFGGRTPTSRAILLLGAPSVFVLQARPVKFMIKQVLYTLLDHPPGIVLSLLPAPQQKILSLNVDDELDAVYGNFIVRSVPKSVEDVNIDDYSDDETDEEEEEEEEDDDDDDDDNNYDDDDDDE
jgi:hypothetical protein